MSWLNPPAAERRDGDVLEVVTGPETDFWRTTAYGFRHDNGHFLGAPFLGEASIEVTFRATFTHAFEHAGLMLYSTPDTWIKAGVELSDGELFASAVVTLGRSDWAVSPLQELSPQTAVTIRASRSGDAVTIRYGLGGAQARQLLRVAYLPPEVPLRAGLLCCSPTSEGLVVRFEPIVVGPCDARLHSKLMLV